MIIDVLLQQHFLNDWHCEKMFCTPLGPCWLQVCYEEINRSGRVVHRMRDYLSIMYCTAQSRISTAWLSHLRSVVSVPDQVTNCFVRHEGSYWSTCFMIVCIHCSQTCIMHSLASRMTRYVLLVRKQEILGYQVEPNINDEATFMSNQSVNQYAKVENKCHDIFFPQNQTPNPHSIIKRKELVPGKKIWKSQSIHWTLIPLPCQWLEWRVDSVFDWQQ